MDPDPLREEVLPIQTLGQAIRWALANPRRYPASARLWLR